MDAHELALCWPKACADAVNDRGGDGGASLDAALSRHCLEAVEEDATFAWAWTWAANASALHSACAGTDPTLCAEWLWWAAQAWSLSLERPTEVRDAARAHGSGCLDPIRGVAGALDVETPNRSALEAMAATLADRGSSLVSRVDALAQAEPSLGAAWVLWRHLVGQPPVPDAVVHTQAIVVQGEDGLVVDLCAARYGTGREAAPRCVADPVMAGTFLIEEDTPALLGAIADAWAWAAPRHGLGTIVAWWLEPRGNGHRQLRIGGPSMGLAAAVAFAALMEAEPDCADRRVAYTGRVHPSGAVGSIGHLGLKADLASRLGIVTLVGPAGTQASSSTIGVHGVPDAAAACRAAGDLARRRELAEARAQAAEQAQRAERRARDARLRGRLATALAVVLAIAIGAAALAWQQRRSALSEADASRRLRTISIANALAAQVPQAIAARADDQAALLARQAYNFTREAGVQPTSQVDQAMRAALAVPNFATTLRDEQGAISSIAFSPDGATLASGGSGHAELWELSRPAATPRILGAANHIPAIWPPVPVVFSPDGKRLATGSPDGPVRLWDPARPAEPPALLSPQYFYANADSPRADVTSLAFSPDGRTLAQGSQDHVVRLWDVGTPGKQPRLLRGTPTAVNSVAFSPDGGTLASGGADGVVRLWDLRAPAGPRPLEGTSGAVNSVAFSPDGTLLASGADDGLVRLWQIGNPGSEPRLLTGTPGPVNSVAFSPDGSSLASGGVDILVRLWDVHDQGAAPRLLSEPFYPVGSLAFSKGGPNLAAGGANGIRLWNLGTQVGTTLVLPAHPRVTSVAFAPGDGTIASGSQDGTIDLWDPGHPNAPAATIASPGDPVLSLAFNPDSGELAWSSEDGSVRVTDATNPVGARTMPVAAGSLASVAFSPDGRALVEGSVDGSVRVWDVRGSGPPRMIRSVGEPVDSIAVSPDSRTLAAGTGDGTVLLWDMAHPQTTPSALRAAPVPAVSLAFSPDGRSLAAGMSNNTVDLWDLRHRRSAAVFGSPDTRFAVDSIAFSPDGRTLAAGSTNSNVRLFDPRRPADNPIFLGGGQDAVASVAFSPDGRSLATASRDGTIDVRAAPSALPGLLCQSVFHNLDPADWLQFVGSDVAYQKTCP